METRYKQIQNILNILEESLSTQYNSLNNKDDVYWDCYNKDNWLSMQRYIIDLSKLLGVEIIDNIEIDCEN